VIGWLSWFCSALNAQASERVEGRRVARDMTAFPLVLYESWSEKRVEPGLMTFRGQQARTPKLLPPFEPFTTGPPLATVHPAADANFTQ
jgi:hypothetical protein